MSAFGPKRTSILISSTAQMELRIQLLVYFDGGGGGGGGARLITVRVNHETSSSRERIGNHLIGWRCYCSNTTNRPQSDSIAIGAAHSTARLHHKRER
jgi:hypothetical protein